MKSLVNIDGKPLEKLICVISNGVGMLYKPHAIKKEADAEAYKIKVIERAKAEAIADTKSIEAETFDRIKKRLIHKELKKQQNIDNVVKVAIAQIQPNETVSDESVNEDWSTRFFNIIEDISDCDMQKLWGQILAGEVKRPKSYSLRTLELLRNLSKEEAKLFIKIANFAIKNEDEHFIFKGDRHLLNNNMLEKYDIKFIDLATLMEIGLIQPGENIHLIFTNNNNNDLEETIMYSSYTLLLKIKANSPKFDIPIYLFTKAGSELLKLVQIKPSFEYISELANFLEQNNVTVQYKNSIEEGIC